MNGMSNKLISAVIVSFGAGNYLKACLESLKRQTYSELEIIVIDNSQGPNLFYCQGLNKGIGMSKGDFILCLNNDVVLNGDFVRQALRGFSLNEKIGMVSGKILRADGKAMDSAGLFLSPWRTAKERGYGSKDTQRFEKEEYIYGVNGAVGFYRKKMLDEIKIGREYFDPDFRMFYEDLDIAWRAQNFGWKGYYIPGAVAYHVRGASVREGKGIEAKFARRYLNNELHFDLFKNRYLAIIKNETCLSFLLHLPLIIVYDIAVWAYILLFKFSLIRKIFSQGIPLSSSFKKRKDLQLRKRRAHG